MSVRRALREQENRCRANEYAFTQEIAEIRREMHELLATIPGTEEYRERQEFVMACRRLGRIGDLLLKAFE